MINCLCNGAWNSIWWFLPFWTDILLVFFHFGIKGLGWSVLNIVNINQINFRGWRPLGLNFGLCPGLRRWGFWWCSMLKRILTFNKCIKKFLQIYWFLNDFLSVSTEGFWPNVTFGCGKKSSNFALAKYLPNTIFGLIISLLPISLLRSNEMKLAKYRIS